MLSQLGAASPEGAASGPRNSSVVTGVILGERKPRLAGEAPSIGTLLGVLILGVLNNGLVLMNINSFWQGRRLGRAAAAQPQSASISCACDRAPARRFSSRGPDHMRRSGSA